MINSQTLMMPDLPEDLVEEILSRVPATSLKRLRSTCKRWNVLFQDQTFSQKHLRNAAKQSLILMLKEYRVCAMSISLNVAPPSAKFKSALSLKYSHSTSEEQVAIALVCHCDGLLLCITEAKRLVVWNPCIGETKWIQLKTIHERSSRFVLGYQSNQSCRNYKILRYWDFYMPGGPFLKCEIYEFSSNTWRVLDNSYPNCQVRPNGVSMKGSIYWLAYLGSNDSCLLCFDFTRENFRHLCLPPYQDRCFEALSVVREEQLSVIHKSFDISKMEIWVTNKFDEEVALLWSKSFTVDLRIHVFGSLLLDEKKKVALCCDLNYSKKPGNNIVYTIEEDNDYYLEIPIVEDSTLKHSICWPSIFNYVPSLIQI